jgi:uncharacterized protein (TIRG00374 family)
LRTNRIRTGLFVGGAVLFVGLLIRIGPGLVLSDLVAVVWLLPVVILFPAGLVTVCDALGWRFAFRRDRVPFLRLLAARLAGEAFNLTTPTASVGGEPIKAWLVRPYVPLVESVPSVLVAKTTHTVAQVAFLAVSLIVAWSRRPGGIPVLVTLGWLVAVDAVAAGGLVAVQILGPVGGTHRMLRRLGRRGRSRWLESLRRIDDDLVRYYRSEPGRLALSVGCHFAGWMLGIVEPYIILRALDVPVGLAEATVVEALGIGVGFTAFLVPARLGAIEAGNVLVFAALGLDLGAAFTLTLVQRVREAVWAGIGMLAMLTFRRVEPVPALEPER